MNRKYKVVINNRELDDDSLAPINGIPRGFVIVETLDEAVNICLDYISRFDLAEKNWMGGAVYTLDNYLVAKITYSGFVVAPNEQKVPPTENPELEQFIRKLTDHSVIAKTLDMKPVVTPTYQKEEFEYFERKENHFTSEFLDSCKQFYMFGPLSIVKKWLEHGYVPLDVNEQLVLYPNYSECEEAVTYAKDNKEKYITVLLTIPESYPIKYLDSHNFLATLTEPLEADYISFYRNEK